MQSSPDQTENPPHNLTRREFIKLGLKALLLAIGSVFGVKRVLDILADSTPDTASNSKPPTPTSRATPKLTATTQPAEVKSSGENDPGYSRLNEILEVSLGSGDREKQEASYVQWATQEQDKSGRQIDPNLILKRIDNGFLAVFNVIQRGLLLDKRSALRESGKAGLRKLSEKEKNWALHNSYHPESLAICIDSYFETLGILKKKFNELGGREFYKMFRPDLTTKKERGELPEEELIEMITREGSVEEMLLNPGGMLYLIGRETGSSPIPSSDLQYLFTDIGYQKAEKMLAARYSKTPKLAKKLIDDLNEVRKFLTLNGPLNYLNKDLPGSTISGDIGSTQFRSDTLLAELKFFKDQFGINFNPFGLKATTLAYLFLARGLAWKDDEGDIKYRIGYLKDSISGRNREPFRRAALDKWNEDLTEEVLKRANKYYDAMIK